MPLIEDLLDQHPELGAPVADVVLRDDVVPNAGEHSAKTVADDGRAQVPDMHLLGDVRRGVVDHHNLRVGRLRHTDVRVGELVGDSLGQHVGPQPEVDEAGSGDLGRLAQIGNLELGDNVRGNLTRRACLPLLARRSATFDW